MGSLGQRIKAERNRLGMTQPEFGKKISVSRNTVASYESGDRVPPIENLAAISKLTKRSIDWFVFGEPEVSEKELSPQETIEAIRMNLSKLEFSIRDFGRAQEITEAPQLQDGIPSNVIQFPVAPPDLHNAVEKLVAKLDPNLNIEDALENDCSLELLKEMAERVQQGLTPLRYLQNLCKQPKKSKNARNSKAARKQPKHKIDENSDE